MYVQNGFEGSDKLGIDMIQCGKEARPVLSQTSGGNVAIPYWGRVQTQACGQTMHPKNTIPMEVVVDGTPEVKTLLFLDGLLYQNEKSTEFCPAWIAAVWAPPKKAGVGEEEEEQQRRRWMGTERLIQSKGRPIEGVSSSAPHRPPPPCRPHPPLPPASKANEKEGASAKGKKRKAEESVVERGPLASHVLKCAVHSFEVGAKKYNVSIPVLEAADMQSTAPFPVIRGR
eukprot:9496616-Pyramimonas_sp.AAC.1